MDVSHNTFPAVARRCSHAALSGFTLIEVLVTLIILAFGLLGLAALQIQGLRYTHEATLRTLAVAFAVEMAERLHANGTAATTGLAMPDIEDWKTRIALRLPEGDGNVELTSTSAGVSVFWNEHGAARQYTLGLTP